MLNIDKKMSLLAILAFYSYFSYYSYKVGESIFFGYPLSFIWADINTLSVILIQNSLIIVAYFILISHSIRKNTSILSGMISIICAYIVISIYYIIKNSTENLFSNITLNIILFFLIFALSSYIKKVMDNNLPEKKWRNVFIGTLIFGMLSMFTGNYFSAVTALLVDNSGAIFISQYKDNAVMIKCEENGNKKIMISSISGLNLTYVSADKHIKRNGLIGKCK